MTNFQWLALNVVVHFYCYLILFNSASHLEQFMITEITHGHSHPGSWLAFYVEISQLQS